MKGMLEWKILAAIFAVLIVSSSALISNSGIKDLFMNSTGSLGDWMQGNPFGSIFSTPEKSIHVVTITLHADNINLDIESPVNITVGESSIKNFRGKAGFDFWKNTSHLLPSESAITIEMPMEKTVIKDFGIKKLVLEEVDFVVKSEKTDISASGERIEIYDFYGDVTITDAVELSGNVSMVKDGKWSIS
jgi:hypothetical protein